MIQGSINNPVGFIGQKILGGTAGVPLSLDANGQLANGLVTLIATATGDTTTGSTSDVLMNSMTVTTTIAGTYFVMFSTSLDHSNQATAIECSIHFNGVQNAASETRAMTRTNALGAQTLSTPMTTFALASIGASQDITGEWRTTAGTATAHERRLIAILVDPA